VIHLLFDNYHIIYINKNLSYIINYIAWWWRSWKTEDVQGDLAGWCQGGSKKFLPVLRWC